MATLRQLKVFLAVAEYKKMNEAAKKLYISQPTISQIISDLESEYNVILFDRLPRELRITPAGALLRSSAREIIAINEQLEESMKNINAIRPLRVGATLTIGNTLMASLSEDLEKKFPDIDLFVYVDNTKNLEQRLISNELDLALVEGVITRKELFTEPILEDSMQIICGTDHPFFFRDSINIDELRNQQFIMREKGSGTRALFENLMLRYHIPFQTRWESTSGTAIIDAVRHNIGLGFLSERCICDYIRSGEIHGCSINDIPLKRFFSVCYNSNHSVTSQMNDFIEIARNTEYADKICSILPQ